MRLGLWHALHPVRATFVLEHRVRAVALDRKREVALAYHQVLGLEAASLGIATEHSIQISGEEAGFVAARPRPDLDDHVLLVGGICLDHRQAERLSELGHLLLGGLQHLPHFRVLSILREQLTRTGCVVLCAFVFQR